MTRTRHDDPSPPRLVRTALGAFIGWSPVWAPLALSLQIVFLGLRPSLHEHRRLELESARLVERYHELAAERRELDRFLRAQADPLYLERERRALRDPSFDIR